MKIIIVYASSGAGHFKAAQALYNYLQKRYPQIQLKLVDVLDKTNAFFKLNYKWGYSYVVRHYIFLWRIAFWITDFRPLRFFTRPIARLSNYLNTKNFARFLIQENPEYILSTHFLSSEIASNLKRSKKIKSHITSIVTDFFIHSFWIAKGIDIYAVASDLSKVQLIRDGVKEENIRVSGIPVDESFLVHYDKDLLCEKIGLDKFKFKVLMMTGSFGLGPIEEIIKLLHKDVQIIVVCASNKQLFAKLSLANLPNVLVLGFADNIPELMAVADVIITKPGGLTTSESLNMRLEPIFISAIPGQESGNVAALRNYGIGFSPKDKEEIRRIILDLKEHPDKLNTLKNNIDKLRNPNVLKDICDVVRKNCSGAAGPRPF